MLTTKESGDSLSHFEEVALLIEVTYRHLERLNNHHWNSNGPRGQGVENGTSLAMFGFLYSLFSVLLHL